MILRRAIKWLLLAGVAAVAGILGLRYALRPTVMERTGIARGVFLTVENLPRSGFGRGRVMVLEVHLDEPGVRVAHRPFSFAVDPDNPVAPHFRLVNADYALAREGALALVNTTIYMPDSLLRSLPGMPVRSVETIVSGGRPSHVHEHSYLLSIDKEGDLHLLDNKPPDAASLAHAVLAVGLQGVPVRGGQIYTHAMDNRDRLMPRNFIGIDPERKVLFIVTCEKASGYYIAQRAIEAGVVAGGPLDSGSSTTLLIGRGAAGVFPHTGIRHWRPLGGYLTVSADP